MIKNKKLIWIARDHLGIKPLFFSLNNGFSFSSTIEGLINFLNEFKDSKLSINRNGVVSYLQFGYFHKVKYMNKLKPFLPGHFACFDIKKNSFLYEKWYQIPNLNKKIQFINI